MDGWEDQFPELFTRAPFQWGGVADDRLEVQFVLERPADHLVSNVKVIGRSGGGVVVCASDQGWRFLPGGTREPGETIDDTARRELFEEAGAVITGPLTWVGAFKVHHPGSTPYRPHLPHPISYWLYVAADVVVQERPTNPADGENVIEVLTLEPAEAADYLAVFDDGPMTDVLRLATAMGHV
ncbi:NUDIX domain-containing protein [Kribbella sp. NPDC023972]|uniref:NUDIX domain-containing protein n=1 Tax=Kribbella sp. NPDC023972 TaxID=3154795 RepID=UPI0033C4BE86